MAAESKKRTLHVAAALIWQKDRFLICRRAPEKSRGLCWEFVGGKLEPGETGEEALIRECREELDVTVEPGEVFMRLTHEYPDVMVDLTLYNAVITGGAPKMLEHVGMCWITRSEIDNFDFCPADREILEKLRNSQ